MTVFSHPTNFDNLYFYYHLLQNAFYFLFTSVLFRNMLCNLQICGYSLAICLLLISSLILLWSKNILCIISILLNLVRYVLGPECGFNKYSMRALGGYVFCYVGCGSGSKLIRFIFKKHCTDHLYSTNFSLMDLSITERKMLKFRL